MVVLIEKDPANSCKKLVDVLIRYGVYFSEEDGRIIVVPVLIRMGLLYHWLKGFISLKPSEREWDNWVVNLKWPERAFYYEAKAERGETSIVRA